MSTPMKATRTGIPPQPGATPAAAKASTSMIDREAQTASWQYRALHLTKGNTTLTGSIVLAIKPLPRWPSKLADRAKIAKDGSVLTGHRADASTEIWDGTFVRVGHVDALTHSFSLLADDLGLSDADRIDMFAHLRAWIAADEREMPEDLHFTKGRSL